MNYQKIKGLPTKGLAKDLINKFNVLSGEKWFSLAIFQSYLVFIPAKFKSWKSNRIPEESIKNITKSDRNFALTSVDYYLLPELW